MAGKTISLRRPSRSRNTSPLSEHTDIRIDQEFTRIYSLLEKALNLIYRFRIEWQYQDDDKNTVRILLTAIDYAGNRLKDRVSGMFWISTTPTSGLEDSIQPDQCEVVSGKAFPANAYSIFDSDRIGNATTGLIWFTTDYEGYCNIWLDEKTDRVWYPHVCSMGPLYTGESISIRAKPA